jgi:Protein of unknown function (DUF3306)
MSEREGFLQRWSRRKREVAQPSPGQAPDQKASDLLAAPITGDATPAHSPATDALVDLSKLPPIDSIAAATDIRPFLAPGVPAELTRAALRRAWTADPSIRDFIGLAENQWDFVTPGGAPGFGSLPDTEQIRKMLTKIIGEAEPEQATSGVPVAQSDESETPRSVAAISGRADGVAEPSDLASATPGPPDDPTVRRNNKNAAAPNDNSQEQSLAPRRHGSALPH